MSESVKTQIGTSVVETPTRLYNPVTERYERVENLSEDGYCRRFLAILHAQTGGVNKIDLNASPVASFDKDKWELRETDGHYCLQKREAETRFDELVLEEGTENECPDYTDGSDGGAN